MSYDIIFLSYQESNADKNWLALKRRFPRAKRVHGVCGIHQAHRKAAERSSTPFFFLVDGDNVIRDDFLFEIPGDLYLKDDTIYVWRCYNPVNELTYGYGAVKLYHQSIIHNLKAAHVDLATTVTTHYHIIHEIASETHFFEHAEEAWRGAFRECAKLTKLSEERQDRQAWQRLQTWLNDSTYGPNAHWVTRGAHDGHQFALGAHDNQALLSKLNDFDWLQTRYQHIAHGDPHDLS